MPSNDDVVTNGSRIRRHEDQDEEQEETSRRRNEGVETTSPSLHASQQEFVSEEIPLRDFQSQQIASRSIVLQERVQGAVTFIDQAVQDVQDFDLLAEELLRVASLLAEFNQGRFGTMSDTILSSDARAIRLSDELLDEASIFQTIEWGVAVAQRMLELLETTNDPQHNMILYISYAGMQQAYVSRVETTLSNIPMSSIARDTTPLRADKSRDPPLSSLCTKCLLSQNILCIMSWEATQEGWSIAELFCALAKQRAVADYRIFIDGYPGQTWCDVNMAQIRQRQRNPSEWVQDIQTLFPFQLPVQWIPCTETTIDDHVIAVAQELSKLGAAVRPRTMAHRNHLVGLMFMAVAIVTVAGVCISGKCQGRNRDDRNAEAIVSFLNTVNLEDAVLRYPTKQNALPEERAMAWLIDEDPMRVPPSNRMVQRFVMATLAFQWEESLVSEDWLSAEHECDWDRSVECSSLNITILSKPEANLQGTTPKNLGLLTYLGRLDLSSNQIIGLLPSELGRLAKLTTIRLHDNNLTGSIPTELALATSLEEVLLHNNAFMGDNPLCQNVTATIDSMVVDCDVVECPCCSECCPFNLDEDETFASNETTVMCREPVPEPTPKPTSRPTLPPTLPPRPSPAPTPRPTPRPTPKPTGRRLGEVQVSNPYFVNNRVLASTG